MSRIEVRALGVAYGDRRVLERVDIVIHAGERVALVGPNGAGKSTLLRCITGLLRNTDGAVFYDGVPVRELDRTAVARRFAVVPQQVILPFALRVEELVALGRIPHEHPLLGPTARDLAARDAALETIAIAELRSRDARELSLGERQLVLLAMAVAQDAPVLLLDEPTVHLDLHHQVRVMQLLSELNTRDETTVLAVLHDLRLVATFFPRVIVLDRGRIAADGPPREVLTGDLIRRVFRVDPALAGVH